MFLVENLNKYKSEKSKYEMPLKNTLEYIDQNEALLLEYLIDFLKIQSISTNPTFSHHCEAAANWLVSQLLNLGFEVKAHKTSGHPIVLASSGEGSTHLLFYGHYDVQPADPLEEWQNDPFEPTIESRSNGKVICARGASDDKGQLMTFINACAAFIKTDGCLPCKITILIEGEEETGSPSLVDFLKKNKETLTADYALICDTGMWDYNTPAISTMLRGMLGEEMTIKAANKDLHSGMYGGPALNPIKELARVVSSLHDKNGKITIDDFYNGVPEVPKDIKQQWNNLNFSTKEFLGAVGLSKTVGEKSYSLLEQIWARPTCEINGIWGGYTSQGFKTVIPSEAHAKISFRLVGNQEPEEIRSKFRKHIRQTLHEDCEVTFLPKDGSKAVSVSIESSTIKAAHKALSEEWGVTPVYAGCGGSIPVVVSLKEILDIDSLLVGFALDDDQIHSPNEKYNLISYQKGAKSWIRIIHELTC